MISLSFARPLVTALVAEGVGAEIRVTINTGEPVALKLVWWSKDLLSKGKYIYSEVQDLNSICEETHIIPVLTFTQPMDFDAQFQSS